MTCPCPTSAIEWPYCYDPTEVAGEGTPVPCPLWIALQTLMRNGTANHGAYAVQQVICSGNV